MYERFSDRARKVMQLANEEAQRFNHEYIGTEHILLGLVEEDSGIAARVLAALEVDISKIRLEVERIVGLGDEAAATSEPVHTPRVTSMIDRANEAARKLNRGSVGTGDLLLVLIDDQDGVAVQILINLGVDLDDLRQYVLAQTTSEDESLAPGGVPVISALELGPLLVVLDDRLLSFEARIMRCARQNGNVGREAQLNYVSGPDFKYPEMNQGRDLVLAFRNQVAEILRFKTRLAHDESESDYVLTGAGFLARKEA